MASRTTPTPFSNTAPRTPIIQPFRLATSAFVATCSSVVSTLASRSSNRCRGHQATNSCVRKDGFTVSVVASEARKSFCPRDSPTLITEQRAVRRRAGGDDGH